MTHEKNSQALDGVKCIVNTCHYHVLGDLCGAKQIEIKPRNASTTEETDCATFRPNEDNTLK
ncbi:MAG: DUF1540 domain-containing protein [Tissierellia bacterium]|nr:DUF1540 domain-containing protein [Tissierellia bacterium]